LYVGNKILSELLYHTMNVFGIRLYVMIMSFVILRWVNSDFSFPLPRENA